MHKLPQLGSCRSRRVPSRQRLQGINGQSSARSTTPRTVSRLSPQDGGGL